MDDLIGEFITETAESLQKLDSELVGLERDPGNTQILAGIFRLVHTIKGTCGFLGLPRLESIAHASENVLGKIRDKVIPVSPEAVSLVLESIDRIKGLVDHLGATGTEQTGDDSDLIATLQAFAESGGAHKTAKTTPPPSQPGPPEHKEPQAEGPRAMLAPLQVAETDAAAIARKAKESAVSAGLAAAAGEPHDTTAGAATAGQTIRVSLDVLESLMQTVGELVLTRNQLLQTARTKRDPAFAVPLQHLSHITTELQEGIMKTRMQPIGNAWSKFPRLMRDLSHELGKKIDLRMLGAETELDRQLLEYIKDPLTHMVRNSADHGLEVPAERLAAGKSETGTVTLSAFHEGGHIIIRIADDGRGLNIERIRRKAVENGLATEAEAAGLSDSQAMQYIFRPGFSTADKVTSVSGRGVGMDVVRSNIEKIGGAIDLDSTPGKGSAITLRIPLTLAIVPVLIVEVAGERFALPQINVQEIVRLGAHAGHLVETLSEARVLRLRGRLLPLLSLKQTLALGADVAQEGFVAVCSVGAYRFGITVDRVFDTEEIVVKPVAQILKSIPLYSGSTILGDGSVIMILDPGGLARASGERDTARKQDAMDELRQAMHDAGLTSFLLFGAGRGAHKAVPLEHVLRLEEMKMEDQEHSGGHPVIQYQGGLMRLRTLDGAPVPATGKKDVIVMRSEGRMLGLVVDAIVDIASAPYDIRLPSDEKDIIGSMLIGGKATDIIDVASLLHGIMAENERERH